MLWSSKDIHLPTCLHSRHFNTSLSNLRNTLCVLSVLFAVPIISSSGLPRSIGDARKGIASERGPSFGKLYTLNNVCDSAQTSEQG